MVVDDEDVLLPHFLEEKGYFVVNYKTGASALDNIRQGLRYNLAIIDLALEEDTFDGIDVINESRRVNPHIPIISMSAYNFKPEGALVHHDKAADDGTKGLLSLVDTVLKNK